MSVRHALVFLCLGFVAGAAFAGSALEELEKAEQWDCGDHYWGLTVTIIDTEKKVAEVDFNGDGWHERQDVAPASIVTNEEKNEIVFKINDKHGGLVRFKLADSVGGETTFDGSAQETKDSGEVEIGTCTKK